MKRKTLVIAGGGTGGHIYPGLALAEFFKKKDPDFQVHFVGVKGGLEEKIIPADGYPLHLLKVGRLHHSVGLLQRMGSFLLLPVCFIQSLYLYFKIRPQWVLGVGGFASGPFVFTTSLLGVRTALLEPNACPGLTNRWLSKIVGVCFVVFHKTSIYFPKRKVHFVGLPVRMKKEKPKLNFFGQRPFQVLIFGGSQGSRAINNIVGQWVENLGDEAGDYKIFHQVGSRDFPIWEKRYSSKYHAFLKYVDYIHDMLEKLKWADLVICRSGIGSVVEVAMSCKPAVFVPLPTASDNHQFENAKALVDEKAAFMIEEKDLTWQKLHHFVCESKNNPKNLEQTVKCLEKFDHSMAGQQIFNILMEENT